MTRMCVAPPRVVPWPGGQGNHHTSSPGGQDIQEKWPSRPVGHLLPYDGHYGEWWVERDRGDSQRGTGSSGLRAPNGQHVMAPSWARKKGHEDADWHGRG